MAGTTSETTQLQRDIDILKNWNGDRGTDQVRTALGNVLNCFENPQVIQALQQQSALSDLRAALSGNASSSIDPAIVAQLQAVQAKFQTVDTTLQTLTAAATSADLGAPTPVPVA